jgi:GH24 family phage-related lysozyme (muramidase)
MNENLHASDECFSIIIADEGYQADLNNDPDGNCEIGYGHLVHLGPIDGRPSEARFAVGISADQAIDLLREDVHQDGELPVYGLVKVILTQAQFDALVSFTYNEGAERLKDSTLLRKLNAGDRAAVPAEFAKWVYGEGKKLAGLVKRRAQEAALFARDLAPAVDVNTKAAEVTA